MHDSELQADLSVFLLLFLRVSFLDLTCYIVKNTEALCTFSIMVEFLSLNSKQEPLLFLNAFVHLDTNSFFKFICSFYIILISENFYNIPEKYFILKLDLYQLIYQFLIKKKENVYYKQQIPVKTYPPLKTVRFNRA